MAAGAVMLLLGGISLWKARLGFVNHVPIYFKGPSWLSPWQALIVGAVCLALGLFLVINALQKKANRRREDLP